MITFRMQVYGVEIPPDTLGKVWEDTKRLKAFKMSQVTSLFVKYGVPNDGTAYRASDRFLQILKQTGLVAYYKNLKAWRVIEK